jgi:uracil-DNA glycosylase
VNGKLVIVGEAPGAERPPDPKMVLLGSTGANLAKIAGWSWRDYFALTERHNLFLDPQPHWNLRKAKAAAADLEHKLEGRDIILLGSKVAEAFGYEDMPNYRWHNEVWANIARVPHPSGRNRVWNDDAERARARLFLQWLL